MQVIWPENQSLEKKKEKEGIPFIANVGNPDLTNTQPIKFEWYGFSKD